MDNKEDVNCESIYPVNKVGWGYGLMGGATGGLIIGLLFVFDTYNIEILAFITMLSIMFGTIIGLPSSIITGVWIAKKEMTITTIEDYHKLFLMGFLVSSVYALLVMFINQYLFKLFLLDSVVLQLIPIIGGMGLVGGFSSLILGKILLPKASTPKASNK